MNNQSFCHNRGPSLKVHHGRTIRTNTHATIRTINIHSRVIRGLLTQCFFRSYPLFLIVFLHTQIIHTYHNCTFKGSWVRYTLFIFYWSSPLLRNKNQSLHSKGTHALIINQIMSEWFTRPKIEAGPQRRIAMPFAPNCAALKNVKNAETALQNAFVDHFFDFRPDKLWRNLIYDVFFSRNYLLFLLVFMPLRRSPSPDAEATAKMTHPSDRAQNRKNCVYVFMYGRIYACMRVWLSFVFGIDMCMLYWFVCV